MELLAILIWTGGAVAAEEIHRVRGRGVVAAFAKAAFWPLALGRALACLVCGGEVRMELQDGDHG